MPDPVAVLVSSLALLFTVLSFWWMYWRSGKLEIGNLQHFAAGRGKVGEVDEANAWFIGLPLILFNTGASPLIVESLRLVPLGTKPAKVLLYDAVDTPLWPADPYKDKVERDFTYLPKIVKPNDAISANFVFQCSGITQKYEAQLYHLHLEAKVTGSRSWQKVKDIELDFRDFGEQKLYELNSFYKVYHYARGERA